MLWYDLLNDRDVVLQIAKAHGIGRVPSVAELVAAVQATGGVVVANLCETPPIAYVATGSIEAAAKHLAAGAGPVAQP